MNAYDYHLWRRRLRLLISKLRRASEWREENHPAQRPVVFCCKKDGGKVKYQRKYDPFV